MLERLCKADRLMVWTMQLGIFVVSGVMAFLLRFDLRIPGPELVHLAYSLAIWVIVKSAVFQLAQLNRGMWRYVSVVDVGRIALSNVAASALSYVVIYCVAPVGFPRSVYLLDMMLCFLGTAGARVAVRAVGEVVRSNKNASEEKKRTLIYGASSAGIFLAEEIRKNPRLPYRIVGFIDDDPQKAKIVIHGTKVLGDGVSLSAVAGKHRVEMVLITIPSATGVQMTKILRRCQQAGVAYKTVPGIGDVIESGGLAKQIRDVAVEDLLGRNPVRLDAGQVAGLLEGKVVLLTGAGGSIGSELCRQIARFRPSAIVAYEIAETALFELGLQLRDEFPNLSFHPEIGNVQNRHRLGEVMERYQPSILYHAAAYKHVPMMEVHMFEAVENNILGTYAAASVAAEYGVEDFVLISTDKAVRPTSIMGATKRVAELVVNSLQNGRTRYVSVRFGNVLGSNGSVVPRFKKQIVAGGPVTVTHPEMERYFMTIPEAAQLVLQASAMGRGGEIFVLEMGEPVKIVDLARNLILLSGLRPEEDIRIKFTGVRPGEKLYEELQSFEESTIPTGHEKIRIFLGTSFDYHEMRKEITFLEQIAVSRDAAQLVLWLKTIVPEYSPSAYVLRHALRAQALAEEKQYPLAVSG